MLLPLRSLLLDTRMPVRQRGGSATGGAGPDAQVSLADYMRRWGPKRKRAPVPADDEEAISVLLCAIAADTMN